MLALSACNPAKFEGQSFSSMGVESSEILSKSFKISEVSFTQEQETLDENVTTLDFEVVDSSGNPVGCMSASPLMVGFGGGGWSIAEVFLALKFL